MDKGSELNFDSSFPPGGTTAPELEWPMLWYQVLPHQGDIAGMVETETCVLKVKTVFFLF